MNQRYMLEPLPSKVENFIKRLPQDTQRRQMMTTTHKHLQERLEAALAELPTKKLEQVVDFAEYILSCEEWDATQELMKYPAMREDVEEGLAQAARGEERSWQEVQRSVRD
ncbi:MAG TPA: hypothetical protein EYM95_14840 [Candidatus Obscuribacterales bacterium]|nr:hypothetical protein [Candidatus Obscuribacterales bacterium]